MRIDDQGTIVLFIPETDEEQGLAPEEHAERELAVARLFPRCGSPPSTIGCEAVEEAGFLKQEAS